MDRRRLHVITSVGSNSLVVSTRASALVIQVTAAHAPWSHQFGVTAAHVERRDVAKVRQQLQCWYVGSVNAGSALTPFLFVASFVVSHELVAAMTASGLATKDLVAHVARPFLGLVVAAAPPEKWNVGGRVVTLSSAQTYAKK